MRFIACFSNPIQKTDLVFLGSVMGNHCLFSSHLADSTPTSYGISDSVVATGGRGLKDPPPLRYHGKSHFGPYIAIDHLLTGT